jgi:hypothetical protein
VNYFLQKPPREKESGSYFLSAPWLSSCASLCSYALCVSPQRKQTLSFHVEMRASQKQKQKRTGWPFSILRLQKHILWLERVLLPPPPHSTSLNICAPFYCSILIAQYKTSTFLREARKERPQRHEAGFQLFVCKMRKKCRVTRQREADARARHTHKYVSTSTE